MHPSDILLPANLEYGCAKSTSGHCTAKYENAHNYGGLPFTPGTTRVQKFTEAQSLKSSARQALKELRK